MRSMESDRIRKELASYLTDLNFVHEGPAGATVEYLGERETDQGWLHWYEINDAIKRLGGSWVKATKYTESHWRIPKS
jgi:hypothetical protein